MTEFEDKNVIENHYDNHVDSDYTCQLNGTEMMYMNGSIRSDEDEDDEFFSDTIEVRKIELCVLNVQFILQLLKLVN